mmetsp:Transcript_26218/g.69995  ORF Transcript_26218/g.69995 Transcript_26218/m.69995 type:complete len:220 (+) Transcript_26218:527-1186(+)
MVSFTCGKLLSWCHTKRACAESCCSTKHESIFKPRAASTASANSSSSPSRPPESSRFHFSPSRPETGSIVVTLRCSRLSRAAWTAWYESKPQKTLSCPPCSTCNPPACPRRSARSKPSSRDRCSREQSAGGAATGRPAWCSASSAIESKSVRLAAASTASFFASEYAFSTSSPVATRAASSAAVCSTPGAAPRAASCTEACPLQEGVLIAAIRSEMSCD